MKIPLLEVLRRRRALPLREVALLLPDLPASIDGTPGRSSTALLHRLAIRVASIETPVETLLRQPLDSWPHAWRLELEPPTVSSMAVKATDETLRPGERNTSAGLPALAELLYELLGGRRNAAGTMAGSPLPAVNEAGNSLLTKAMRGAVSGSCADFWGSWLRACEWTPASPPAEARPHTPRGGAARIPDDFLGVSERGTVLSLTSSNGRVIPIRLVARPQFRFGRSSRLADWVARILPDNPENLERTKQLSRVHATAEYTAEGIVMQDGDGFHPSANGSRWDGSPLHTAASIGRGGVLEIGPSYSLEATAVPAVGEHIQIANLADWIGAAESATDLPRPSLDSDAFVFAPVGMSIIRQAVWLISRLGFECDGAGAIQWDLTGAAPVVGAFIHAHGGFWLQRGELLETTITLDGHEVLGGAIVPLTGGQRLRLGSTAYETDLK